MPYVVFPTNMWWGDLYNGKVRVTADLGGDDKKAIRIIEEGVTVYTHLVSSDLT